MSGYSGTPLARKLSLKDGMRVWWDGMPDQVRSEIERESLVLIPLEKPEPPIDAAHIFVTECAALERKLHALLPLLERSGFIWVSWPKKAVRRMSGGQPSSRLAKAPTDISEDVIREVALPMHLVDVKVCAVDNFWSGLKLVIRKEHR